jgi:hypothetical protein
MDPAIGMAEAAYAIAPPTVTGGVWSTLPKDVEDLLGFVDVYAAEHPDQGVVWFSDVTRWLEWEKDSSWSILDVDWEHALEQLPELPLLGLYMTVSRRAYTHLVNTAEVFELIYTDGTREVLSDAERDDVHEALRQKLETDWPRYIGDMVRKGYLHID